MIVTRVKLKNWRNFKDADARLREVTYVLGANATGKSNFLEVFRFLRDVVKPRGGSLQSAVLDRGGLAKLRCLHARRHPEVAIEIELSETQESPGPLWIYHLAFKSEGRGANRPIIVKEEVVKIVGAKRLKLVDRPNDADRTDHERLTQTFLEQVSENKDFRDIVGFFASLTYLHLVPQLIKYGEFIGGRQLENDPFGQAFLERVAGLPEKTRSSRLKRIEQALKKAIPQFENLEFKKDEAGHPHLEARYSHHRPHAGLQREDQFSDGTLRLIALFWLLMDGDGLLLLEEPELSLDEHIIQQLPRLIDRVSKSSKRKRRQIVITTHSQALLDNKAIDGFGVLRLERAEEGTRIVAPSVEEVALLQGGLSVADVLLPKVHPKNVDQLALL
ncbi:AAA family ATPase [Rhodopseudomonas palustris]|nr:AAA family ATPase [Rhodopseudomonas palustris]